MKIVLFATVITCLTVGNLKGQVAGNTGPNTPGLLDECDMPSYLANPTWIGGGLKVFTPCEDIKVGIGTRNPAYNLHNVGSSFLNGNVHAMSDVGIGSLSQFNANLYVKNKVSYTTMVQLKQTGVSPNIKMLYMQVEDPSANVLVVDNTAMAFTPFVLKASGQMVIRNAVKAIFQLDSDGLLRARKIKVDTDIWPDYVFEKDYKLMTLVELDSFVNNNGHLPRVPRREEIISSGMDLGEINVILLEKIEELVLYTIQQQKEIDELKTKIK